MAGNKSNFLEAAHIAKDFGQVNYTPPVTHYIALYTAMPTDVAATGTEVVIGTGGYARVAVTNNNTTWILSPAGDQASNGIAITYAQPTTNWGLIVGWAIKSASTAGNTIYYGPVTPPVNVLTTSDPPSFAIGALVITES